MVPPLLQTRRRRVPLRVPPPAHLPLLGRQRLERPLYNHRLPSTTLCQRILLAHNTVGSRRPHQSQNNHPSRTSFVIVLYPANFPMPSVVSNGLLLSKGFNERPTKVRRQVQNPPNLRIKTLQQLKLSPHAVQLLPQLRLPQIIAFNHRCQPALKRIHPRVDTDCPKTRTSGYWQCLLRKAQALSRSCKTRGPKRHRTPIVIELLHLIDLPSQRMTPETRLESLRADGGLVLQNEAIAWRVEGVRQAVPIRDAVRTTVIGDQDVKNSIVGPNVGRPLPVMTTARGTARGTVKEMLGNENENERRIEAAGSPTVNPLAGIANESGMLQEADCLLDLVGISLEMNGCNLLGAHRAENAPVTQGRKKCVLRRSVDPLLTPSI